MVYQMRWESVRPDLARAIDRAALLERTFQFLFGPWADWEEVAYLPLTQARV